MFSRLTLALLLLSILAFFTLSCHSTAPVATGHLEVYVFNGQGAEAGKWIEVRGTLLSKLTDTNGMAVFEVAAGEQVVRAHEINRGGPCCPYVDQNANIQAGETTRIEFFDCTECVASAS